jgi:hypothetical protein
MLTKQQCADCISVEADGLIAVRILTQVMEGDVEVTSAYHRITLMPGADLSGQDPKVVAVADAVWTPEVIQAYQQKMQDIEL